MKFLSTPSARRATRRACLFCHSRSISIHALREEGDTPGSQTFPSRSISIHALREEGDRATHSQAGRQGYFYPRPPRGGRRLKSCHFGFPLVISIHALREEGDIRKTCQKIEFDKFLSTPSARRATAIYFFIHSDAENFYPRPPRGGRHGFGGHGKVDGNFYPRPPRGGRPKTARPFSTSSYFYPRPPRGGRRRGRPSRPPRREISIHALREEGDSKNRDKISIFL